MRKYLNLSYFMGQIQIIGCTLPPLQSSHGFWVYIFFFGFLQGYPERAFWSSLRRPWQILLTALTKGRCWPGRGVAQGSQLCTCKNALANDALHVLNDLQWKQLEQFKWGKTPPKMQAISLSPTDRRMDHVLPQNFFSCKSQGTLCGAHPDQEESQVVPLRVQINFTSPIKCSLDEYLRI